MATGRSLLLATIIAVKDSRVCYPCCTECYSKLLFDTLDRSFWCSRCRSSYECEQVMYRYRLLLTVSERSSLCNITVFGKSLEPFFGTAATPFNRILVSLGEKCAEIECDLTELVTKSLEATFIGEKFWFGFKMGRGERVCDNGPRSPLHMSYILQEGKGAKPLDNLEQTATMVAYQMIATRNHNMSTVLDNLNFLQCQKHEISQKNTNGTHDTEISLNSETRLCNQAAESENSSSYLLLHHITPSSSCVYNMQQSCLLSCERQPSCGETGGKGNVSVCSPATENMSSNISLEHHPHKTKTRNTLRESQTDCLSPCDSRVLSFDETLSPPLHSLSSIQTLPCDLDETKNPQDLESGVDQPTQGDKELSGNGTHLLCSQMEILRGGTVEQSALNMSTSLNDSSFLLACNQMEYSADVVLDVPVDCCIFPTRPTVTSSGERANCTWNNIDIVSEPVGSQQMNHDSSANAMKNGIFEEELMDVPCVSILPDNSIASRPDPYNLGHGLPSIPAPEGCQNVVDIWEEMPESEDLDAFLQNLTTDPSNQEKPALSVETDRQTFPAPMENEGFNHEVNTYSDEILKGCIQQTAKVWEEIPECDDLSFYLQNFTIHSCTDEEPMPTFKAQIGKEIENSLQRTSCDVWEEMPDSEDLVFLQNLSVDTNNIREAMPQCIRTHQGILGNVCPNIVKDFGKEELPKGQDLSKVWEEMPESADLEKYLPIRTCKDGEWRPTITSISTRNGKCPPSGDVSRERSGCGSTVNDISTAEIPEEGRREMLESDDLDVYFRSSFVDPENNREPRTAFQTRQDTILLQQEAHRADNSKNGVLNLLKEEICGTPGEHIQESEDSDAFWGNLKLTQDKHGVSELRGQAPIVLVDKSITSNRSTEPMLFSGRLCRNNLSDIAGPGSKYTDSYTVTIFSRTNNQTIEAKEMSTNTQAINRLCEGECVDKSTLTAQSRHSGTTSDFFGEDSFDLFDGSGYESEDGLLSNNVTDDCQQQEIQVNDSVLTKLDETHLDSQTSSPAVMKCGFPNELPMKLDRQKTVQFSRRLSCVSNIQLMDIRMRIAPNPMTRPRHTFRSCLKQPTANQRSLTISDIARQQHQDDLQQPNSELINQQTVEGRQEHETDTSLCRTGASRERYVILQLSSMPESGDLFTPSPIIPRDRLSKSFSNEGGAGSSSKLPLISQSTPMLFSQESFTSYNSSGHNCCKTFRRLCDGTAVEATDFSNNASNVDLFASPDLFSQSCGNTFDDDCIPPSAPHVSKLVRTKFTIQSSYETNHSSGTTDHQQAVGRVLTKLLLPLSPPSFGNSSVEVGTDLSRASIDLFSPDILGSSISRVDTDKTVKKKLFS